MTEENKKQDERTFLEREWDKLTPYQQGIVSDIESTYEEDENLRPAVRYLYNKHQSEALRNLITKMKEALEGVDVSFLREMGRGL